MGLNTLVKKLYVPTENSDMEDFHAFDEYPELEVFDIFRVYRPIERFDFSAFLLSKGYRPDIPVDIIDWNLHEDGSFRATIQILDTEDGLETEDEFEVINPPHKTVMAAGVFAMEIADLRKGANSLFYDEDRWNGSCVTSREDLDYVFQRYFSTPVESPPDLHVEGDTLVLPVYTEYKLSAEEMSRRFEEEIIENFVEGETFVKFS